MRRLNNWLDGLMEGVENTETPRHFWYWSGIFTLGAALRRRVWLPYGIESIYPNLHLIIVAPPGRCRKAAPVSISKRMLNDIQIPVSVDSTSKRALTKELEKVSQGSNFQYKNHMLPQATLAIISKEMSSLLAIDPKGMIEVLTDLYDSHDSWKYKTSGEGQDKLYGVCVSCLIATTPKWMTENLPGEAIGGGYTSRNVILYAERKAKRIAIPKTIPNSLYRDLVSDLNQVANLVGEFKWGEGSEEFFSNWYHRIPELRKAITDERVHPFIERVHVVALKTAMAIRVSYSDDLTITVEDLELAISKLGEVLKDISSAFGGHGRSRVAPDIDRVLKQIEQAGKITEKQLLAKNWREIDLYDLQNIIENLSKMGVIEIIHSQDGQKWLKWKGYSSGE